MPMKSSDTSTAMHDLTAERPRVAERSLDATVPRTGALVVLLVGVALEQPAVEVGVATVKPEHVVLALLWLVAGWRMLSVDVLRQGRLLLWIVPYLAVLLLASLISSPDPVASVRQSAMVALVASAAWLAYLVANTKERLALAVEVLVWLAAAEAALIFISLALAWIGVQFGAQPGRGGIPVPNGTLWEPNLLGSYLAAGGVLALSSLLSTVSSRRAMVLAGALTVVLSALGLSLARGAWLGFAAGVILLGVGLIVLRLGRAQPRGTLRRNIVLAVLAASMTGLFLTIIAPAFFPGTSAGLGSRLNVGGYDPQSDPSVRARFDTVQQALPDIWAQPVIGHGAGSFGLSHQDDKGNAGWIANLELHVLYDSGLLGLGCWVVGFAGLAWAAWRFVRTWSLEGEHGLTWITLGLLGAVAALFVAFQATEGSWLAFPWVYLGLLVAAFGLGIKRAQPARS
jgi:O-antigen ligase